jgi:hypothetical protein
MELEVFEILHGFNDGMEEAIGQLESLETVKGFGESVASFLRDAERLRAGVNRYMAERIHKDADEEAIRIDKQRAAEQAAVKEGEM